MAARLTIVHLPAIALDMAGVCSATKAVKLIIAHSSEMQLNTAEERVVIKAVNIITVLYTAILPKPAAVCIAIKAD